MKGCLAAIFVILVSGILIGHIARIRHHENIESLLNQRVSGLKDEFPETTVSYDHLTAKITGRASRKELEEIKKRFDELRQGNGRVEYSVEIVRRVPSSFSIVRENHKVTVQGTIDSNQTKRDLESTVSLSGLSVDNLLEISEDAAPFPALVSAVSAIPLLVHSAGDARLEANPNVVSVSGTVNTDEVRRILSGMFTSQKWNDAEIINELKVRLPPPLPQPPSLFWTQEGRKITLEGSLPSGSIRDSLIKTAKEITGQNGSVVADKLSVGANISNSDWLTKFPQFAGETLPNIVNPTLRLGPNDSTFTGSVVGSKMKEDVCVSFAEINPPGLVINLKVLPLPRTRDPWITITKGHGQNRVNGIVPSTISHGAIMNAIRRVDDKLTVSEDVKAEPWLDALPGFIITYYGKVKDPELSLREQRLILKGKVSDEAIKKEMHDEAASLERHHIQIVNQLEIEKPPSPTGQPVDKNGEPGGNIKERHEVFFGTGEFHIRKSEQESVAAILSPVKATKGKIVIDGYADERGDTETNKYLSQQRANQLQKLLINNGVDPKRISSVKGHGEKTGITYPEFRKTEVHIME